MGSGICFVDTAQLALAALPTQSILTAWTTKELAVVNAVIKAYEDEENLYL
jgi:hypothetical protein